MPKRKLERKVFIWFIISHCCSFAKKVKTETQTGQELGDKNRYRGQVVKNWMEKGLLTVTEIILLLAVTGPSPNE